MKEITRVFLSFEKASALFRDDPVLVAATGHIYTIKLYLLVNVNVNRS